MTHNLKIQQEYLQALMDGTKKSEVRLNDRGYRVGDILRFWYEINDDYVFFKITHIHKGLGMQENYVVLSVDYSLKEEND